MHTSIVLRTQSFTHSMNFLHYSQLQLFLSKLWLISRTMWPASLELSIFEFNI